MSRSRDWNQLKGTTQIYYFNTLYLLPLVVYTMVPCIAAFLFRGSRSLTSSSSSSFFILFFFSNI
ncbi:hypothetical protein BO79DRAFT_9643 [Aspergillus costaricaensis CBS 115574]|uniref:Uncharacterized protein n=1 Tax=Aspergillus costaricaensis CBS 115574 TaxID=1448317 RepID=A0ACD1IHN4_9EURO|nr:hypothetical protein BO79DRAFT_9643 [Aspergillus costaricaensis CBS 115574]RAK89958.1 hypothetical protein BO79DRAFT_9643 [Aspergillus costaricaensis CBS 115574]